MPAVSIKPSAARNSELYKLVKDGVLKPGQVAKAELPSGREIKLIYVKNDGTEKAREMSEMYGFPIKPEPEEYISRSIVNSNGNIVVSKHDIVPDGTRLTEISEHCPKGIISQVFLKDGSRGGHIWTEGPKLGIVWGYNGNVACPDRVSNCIHKPPYRNENSVEAFKAATDYIRGKGSLEAYNSAVAK